MTKAYAGRILRVHLTRGEVAEEELPESVLRMWVGGTGLGSRALYDEVPAQARWSDPENRMIWACGLLGGTKVSGTGIFSIVTRGPMTNLAVATQANGFLGAFLKFSGFDAIIFEGLPLDGRIFMSMMVPRRSEMRNT